MAKIFQKYCVCFLISRESFQTAFGIGLKSHNTWDPRPVKESINLLHYMYNIMKDVGKQSI